MGDTLDETPPTRRDKPHTLNIGQEEEGSAAAPGATASSIAIPAARSPRNRMRHADRDAKRDHSSDGLVTSGTRRDEFTGLEVQPRRESLNSCEAGSPVALSTSLGKAGRLSSAGSSRYPSGGGGGGGSTSGSGSGIGVSVLGGVLGGTTTRKCVLTLDGYSYVIVASTPESLPSKRDEASVGAGATGGSSGAASGNSGSGAASSAASGAAGSGSGSGTGAGAGGAGGISSTSGQEAASPTVSELSGSGPNATINGQVARHGSLTIIRRTNSRNFNQNEGQQLASPSAATASSTSITFAQTPLSEPLAERLSFRSGSNGPASAGDSRSSNQGSSSGATATTAAAKMQPSSPNSTNYAADNLQISSANLSQSESTDHTASHSLNALGTGSFLRGETDIPTTSRHSYETTSNLSFNAGQWETESLPPVDTPDALNKAAGRIRSLLRRMDHETVAYEDMQRNLHYAARVLEAVFIDESRSPTSGKTRLGQIASSSVESEEEDCNGDCKNLSCSRHSHGRDPDQQQDNNNSNSSCSLKKVEEEKVKEQQEEVATTSDNQASIEGRTKGVSLAPQTHSGPTGPPATTSSSENSVSTAPAASKLQPALETVRESVLEENSSKGPAPAPASTSTSTSASASASAATDPSAKAAESVTSGGSSSSGNPATVHRQRRLRTPTWARSMSTNKTYLNLISKLTTVYSLSASSVRSFCDFDLTFCVNQHSSRMNLL